MSFFKKAARSVGKVLSGVSKVGSKVLGGVESVARGITKIPIVGGIVKEVYEETPLKAVGDIARRVSKDAFKIGEGLGTALQEQNVKGLIKGGKQALGLAKDVRRQAPEFRQNLGEIVPSLRQRMQQQIKPMMMDIGQDRGGGFGNYAMQGMQ